MTRLLRPLVALLLAAGFVALPASGVALSAETGSYTFTVDPIGTISRATGEVTLTGTYVCTVPDGYVQADGETQIGLTSANQRYDTIVYTGVDTQFICDGQLRDFTASEFFAGFAPGKASYSAAGYRAWDNEAGDYGQADYFLDGTVRLIPTR
jgi:hypothetical protein